MRTGRILPAFPDFPCLAAPVSHSHQSKKIELRSSGDKGVGTFAVAPISRGEVLLVTGGRIVTREEAARSAHPLHPFQVEGDLHLAPTSEHDGIFAVNHSCEPNAGLRGQLTLVALRPIAPGEEICFDYAMTDSDVDGRETYRMRCLCGEKSCRGEITDLDWRRPDLREKYRGFFSSYLAARIAGGNAP
ncbi:MAG: SET domain-containing protein-lysine N-methyltransferase [Deltaproteobacteria bacterium]|nr:SET domain-containing protein-lysine N-methyltransferase [Deltaproteobacteria bacterium]